MKVAADPEVGLTAIERRKLYDMAMEMHQLQGLATQVSSAVTPLNTRMGELAKEIASRNDIPADVKAALERFTKKLTAVAPKFAVAGGGRGGGGRGGAAAATRRRAPNRSA